MKYEKIFLLFGASGALGRVAIDYFLEKNFDNYYFFAREGFKISSQKKIYDVVTVRDLSLEENVKNAFYNVRKSDNAIYYLFSAIGGYVGGKSIAETEYSDWQKMINVNLNTSFLISKYFSKLIEKTGGGSICFTSASSSLTPEADRAAYNISKSALNYLVKTLALEGKSKKIFANAVAPYIIDSPANREWVKDKTQLVSPLEICNVVHSIFEEFDKISGQIFDLPKTCL